MTLAQFLKQVNPQAELTEDDEDIQDEYGTFGGWFLEVHDNDGPNECSLHLDLMSKGHFQLNVWRDGKRILCWPLKGADFEALIPYVVGFKLSGPAGPEVPEEEEK